MKQKHPLKTGKISPLKVFLGSPLKKIEPELSKNEEIIDYRSSVKLKRKYSI